MLLFLCSTTVRDVKLWWIFSVVNGKCGLFPPQNSSEWGGREVFNFDRHKLTRKGIFQEPKKKSFSLEFSSFFLDIPHCHAAVIAGEVASLDNAHQHCSRTEPCPRELRKNTNEPGNWKKRKFINLNLSMNFPREKLERIFLVSISSMPIKNKVNC